MQAFQCTQELCCVEPGAIDVKALFPLKVVEEFATVDKGKDKVQFFGGLK